VHAAFDRYPQPRDGRFADPQLTLRSDGCGTFAVVARHCPLFPPLKIVRAPRWSAGIQVVLGESGETGMAGTSPAYAVFLQLQDRTL